MKTSERLRYNHYQRDLDVEAVEAALGWEALREGVNKHGEPEQIGHCPDPWNLHKNGDTTGKFAINRAKRVYHCFVCGGGTLLDLAMAIKGIDEQEAEEWLFDFTGITEKTDIDFLTEIEAILYQEERAKPVMPYYNEHVLEKWTANLDRLEVWLLDRGISEEVALSARVGYQADALRMAPIEGGKPRERAYEGPSVFLPHFWGGRLVGWQQRWLDEHRPKWIPKYTNTSAFPKTDTVYGYEDVYMADRAIIVCESVCTVLFLRSLGYPAVAVFGASVSAEQMRLLRRFTQGIVLAPDNDGPGWQWLGYSEEEHRRRKLDRVLLAKYLATYVPVRVIMPVGEFGSGNDLGDLLDEGPRFAAKAVGVLYAEAEYY